MLFLKKMGKGFQITNSLQGVAISRSFLDLLIRSLLLNNIIYNIFDGIPFHECSVANFQVLKVGKNSEVYLQEIVEPIIEQILTRDEINEDYKNFSDHMSFENYQDFRYMKNYQTLFVVQRKVVMPKMISKIKEVLNVFDKICSCKLIIDIDGDFDVLIEKCTKENENLIRECVDEFNSN